SALFHVANFQPVRPAACAIALLCQHNPEQAREEHTQYKRCRLATHGWIVFVLANVRYWPSADIRVKSIGWSERKKLRKHLRVEDHRDSILDWPKAHLMSRALPLNRRGD